MWDLVAILARDIPPLCDKTVRAWLPKEDKHCLMAGQAPTKLFKENFNTNFMRNRRYFVISNYLEYINYFFF